nr:M67 family metallopeptidase [Nodosilinea sp. TSF1-S3]
MGLCITFEHYRALTQAAVTSYPSECCGLLVGRRGPVEAVGAAAGDRAVVEVVALKNAWEPALLSYTDGLQEGTVAHSVGDRYYIDPADLLVVQRQARERDLEIIGIYHSHPDHPAVPSECDRALAWPVYSYIILSVVAGHVVELKSWRLDDQHQFQNEPVKMIGSSANKAPFLS